MTAYEEKIGKRNLIHLVLGGGARFGSWVRTMLKVRKMRKQGAKVGLPIGIAGPIAVPASKNLVIGEHCSIQTAHLDVRSPLKIGNFVIIGDDVRIITASHNIDSPEWEFKTYGIEIEDYVWIATRAMILPSCRRIGRGAVIGAGSVVVKDVPPMAVVSGNPAQVIRYRKCVHENRVVEELLCGDFLTYCKTALRVRKIR